MIAGEYLAIRSNNSEKLTLAPLIFIGLFYCPCSFNLEICGGVVILSFACFNLQFFKFLKFV